MKEKKMKKQIRLAGFFWSTAIASMLVVGLAYAGTAAKAPQEAIIIDGKKPAKFSHPTHLNMGLDCASCHHDKEHNPLSSEAIGALADTGALKCVSCHNNDHPNADLRKLKNVFHARCKECHAKGFAGKKGPTKCTSCHLKKKKAYEGC